MLGIGNFEHKLDFGFDDDVVLAWVGPKVVIAHARM